VRAMSRGVIEREAKLFLLQNRKSKNRKSNDRKKEKNPKSEKQKFSRNFRDWANGSRKQRRRYLSNPP
jgi:hypothetical protein